MYRAPTRATQGSTLKVGHYKPKRTPAPKCGPPQKAVPAKNKGETKMAA
jgi:hypothetical protein